MKKGETKASKLVTDRFARARDYGLQLKIAFGNVLTIIGGVYWTLLCIHGDQNCLFLGLLQLSKQSYQRYLLGNRNGEQLLVTLTFRQMDRKWLMTF